MTASSTRDHDAAVTEEDRRRYGRRAQLLAGASVTYNVVEALLAISAGLVAGSIALIGFGLDSIVEVSSGLIIVWQFRHRLPESREQTALRLMAFSFFALAAYVTFESARSLTTGREAESSTVGVFLAAASLVIMPFLSWAQRRTGRALGSNAVVAALAVKEGRQAWRGEGCCAPTRAATTAEADGCGCGSGCACR